MNKKKITVLVVSAILTSNLTTQITFAEGTAEEDLIISSSFNDVELENNIININDQLTEYNKLFEYSNLQNVNGSGNGNISQEVDKVKELESGTIIMRFDNKSTTGFQTLLSFSKNTTNNERVYVFVESNKLGIERQSSDGNYKHVSQALTFNSGINTVAFKIDKNVGYSIFLNGAKVLNVPTTTTKFIKGIPGINSVNIGLSDRLNFPENPLTGDVDFVSLYSDVISDEELLSITGQTVANATANTPFIKEFAPLEANSNFNVGEEVTFNVEFDQAVSLIGNKTLTLLIDGVEMPINFEEQVDIKNYKFKGIIPEGISSGVHEIILKAMSGLDIVNVNAKLMNLSSDIITTGKIVVGEDAISKAQLQDIVDSCLQLEEENFTTDSWNILQQALVVANDVLNREESTLIEIYDAKVALENAKNALERLIEFDLRGDSIVKASETIDIKLAIEQIGDSRDVQAIDAVFVYDTTKFKLGENAITAIDESKTFVNYLETTPGTVRVIIGSLEEPVVESSDIINIKLTAKESIGIGDISVTGKYAGEDSIKDLKSKTIEIQVVEKEATVDKNELQELVDICSNLNEADYTVETWTSFAAALENARIILANEEATQSEVDLALGQLQVAKDGLVEKEEPTEVYKNHLEITVEVAEGITDFTDVVPAVKAEFDAALAEAVALLANTEATQEQVNKSFDRLSKAIHMLEFKGNKEQLMNLLAQIEALDSSKYTKESWDALQAVINRNDIQEVINDENALQADIERAYNDIFTAFSELVEVSEQVNKDKLNNLIGKVEGLDANEYIDTTWNNLLNALNTAKAVSANADATQAQVDEAHDNLLRAYLDLRLKPSKDKLEDLINKAEGLDASKYTAKSYKAVKTALKSAKAVYADEKATAEDISKAEKNLEVAMANLQAKDQGSSNNGESNNGQGSSNNGSGSNSGSSNSGKLPNTGGTPAAAVGLLGTIFAAIGAVMFKRKRK